MKYLLLLSLLLAIGCASEEESSVNDSSDSDAGQSMEEPEQLDLPIDPILLTLDLQAANNLAELPLACIEQEYPNKLGQTIGSVEDLGEPSQLHPAFYGCFDWHSAVHGHWSLVSLLSMYPDIGRAEEAKELLSRRLTAEHIAAEVEYFEGPLNGSYERTYGWAWLLELQRALLEWDDPLGPELAANLQPLADLIVSRYIEYLPKLVYPIRTGEHPNTGFGLAFAYDYALATGHTQLKELISARSKEFFLEDRGASFDFEPSGYDFLSPILEEVDIMRRVLPETDFHSWLADFLPELIDSEFTLAIGLVGDRTDGKLVHLDGLNFSRAWVLNGLAEQYPRYDHLRDIADTHIAYSLPNLIGDSYEGGHWLGSFAIYALKARN
ncbi:MAG: DUF2891 domain-containing protein [Bacteroidota bacterium]